MKVIIDTPEGIAKQAAAIYKEILDAKPNAVLGFATGSTPLDTYAELIKLYEAGEISFKDVTTFNLDEYVGLEPTHDPRPLLLMTQPSKRPAARTCTFWASA